MFSVVSAFSALAFSFGVFEDKREGLGHCLGTGDDMTRSAKPGIGLSASSPRFIGVRDIFGR